MSFRIEITFSGEAPDDELRRAHIIADANVTKAMEGLSLALENAGFPHETSAKTVRSVPGRKRKPAEAPSVAPVGYSQAAK